VAPPDDYGWAYIDPQRASASADGPETSVQFRYGADSLIPGKFSGSNDFTFQANDLTNQGGPGSGSVLTVTGALYVSGTIYADNYTIREITSTQIAHSGSTTFGNTSDDNHMITGSLWVSREMSGSEALHVQSSSSFGDYMTFHHTITGAVAASAAGGDGDVHVNKAILNDLRVSGSSIKGANANTTHQITGSFEVSNTAVFSSTVQASEYIYHQGDLNTFIRFQADDIDIQAGGVDFIKITEDDSQDLVRINPANADVDFIVSTSQSSGSLKIDGGTGDIHFGGERMVFDYSEGTLLLRPGTSKKGRLILQSRDTTAADAPQMDFQHYTDGTLAQDDYLGEIYFRGAETETGTYYAGAAISAQVDEAAWTDGSSTAGKLRFFTTSDGAASLSERMRIGADGTTSVTGALEVSTNVIVSNELHTNYGIRHLGDPDTRVILTTDEITIQPGGVTMITATEDDSQDKVIINEGRADVDFHVHGDTNVSIFHIQAAAEASGPAEMVHISGTLGPVSGSGEIHAAKFVGNNAEFSGSLSIHNIGDGARPGLTTLSISNSGSTPAITLTGGMTASHDVKVEHLYTNDLYVSGTCVGVTVDRSNYASSSDGATPRTYSPTGFDTSGYLHVSGSTILGDVGATSHQITGSFEVSGPAHFTDEVHAESILSVDSHARLGNGPTDVVTFYNTITGSGDNDSNLQSSIFASHIYAWALNTSGSSVLGSAAADTHQVTGSLEVSNTAVFSSDVQVSEYIYHQGDANTYIQFSADDINVTVGGVNMLDFTEGGTDSVVFNEAGADVDFRVESDNVTGSIFVDAASDMVHIQGDAFSFDSDGTLRIRPNSTSKKGRLILQSRDTTAADAPQMDFQHYTDGTLAEGDFLGEIYFRGAETETGTYYAGSAIAGLVDEGAWTDGSSTAGSLRFYTTPDGSTTLSKRVEIGSDGAVEITGSLEVSGPANFTSVTAHEAGLIGTTLSASSTLSIQGKSDFGDSITFFHTISGSENGGGGADVHCDKVIINDLWLSGSSIIGVNANTTHQVTGSFEVSGPANFTSATTHEAGLISTTISGSDNLSCHGTAHIGGTLTMDGAGIVFNVANSAGTVNLQVQDGGGADTAITLGKNGKVTKIGDDTPTDGQVLSWDALGGKVAWSDGTTPDMSGSDNHYTSTEFRTSGDLKVSGSSTLVGDVLIGEYLKHSGDPDTNIRFEADKLTLSAGAQEFIQCTETTQDILTINPEGEDIDFKLMAGGGTGANGSIFMQGNDGTVHISGTLGPMTGSGEVHVAGVTANDINISGSATFARDVYIGAGLIHVGDTDTKIDFTTDQMDFTAGNVNFLRLDETTQDVARFNPANADIDFQVSTSISSGSLKVDGGSGDVHLCGDTFTFDHDEGVLRIRPGTTKQGTIRLHSRDATSADEAQLQFMRYTDGSLTTGDNLGIIQFKGAETEDGTYYTAASIVAEVDEASWIDNSSCAGRLLFYTTADGATAGTERFRIDSDGTCHIANTLEITNGIAGDLQINGNDIKDSGGNMVLSFDGAGNIDNDIKVKAVSANIDLLSTEGESSLRIYGDGGGMADGDNIGSVRFYGTENDGTNSAQVGYMLMEVADSSFQYASSAGGMMKFGVGVDGSTSVDEVLFLDGGNGVQARVGIGTLSPEKILHVAAGYSSGYVALIENTTNDNAADGLAIKIAGDTTPEGGNSFLKMLGGATTVGYIVGDGSGGVSYTEPFTGKHPTVTADSSNSLLVGLIMSSTGEIWVKNTQTVSTGLPKVTMANTDNDKGVFGIISDTPTFDPDVTEGGLDGEWSIYDGYFKFNSVGEDESALVVNSMGEGLVWVTNKNGEVEQGDYICSTVVPGHGGKQADDLLHNYTVAKCVEAIDWDSVTDTIEHGGVTYKKYLTACTYNCG